MNLIRQILLLYVILFAGCTPGNKKRENNGSTDKAASPAKQQFVAGKFNFSFDYSTKWNHQVFDIGNNQTLISIYPADKADSIDFPLTIHENASLSYISIFPDGYGTELPSGKSRSIGNNSQLQFDFEFNKNDSRVFILDNGQEWGYFIVPSSPPDGWSSYGFIFAQAAVSDFRIKCFDDKTGEELEMSECNPLSGDSLVRYGEVVKEDLQEIKRILKSFKFENTHNGQQPVSVDEAKGIKVISPQVGSVITSPLNITGKARGTWFFEALIEIELRKDGELLATATGKAQGSWMTQDYVDFSATLNFPDVEETGRAELLFRNSNPSGKSDTGKTFSIPVTLR